MIGVSPLFDSETLTWLVPPLGFFSGGCLLCSYRKTHKRIQLASAILSLAAASMFLFAAWYR